MVRGFLGEEFQARLKKNPQYSLRAYARALGVHSGTLSAILSGSRPLTDKAARKFLSRLNVDPRVTPFLLEPSTSNAKEIDADTFEAMSSWEYDAVLTMLETAKSRKVSQLGKRLGLSASRVLGVLMRLEKLGLVRRGGDGWESSGEHLKTSPQVRSAAIRRVHRQYLDKAIEALEDLPAESRDITGMTLAVNSRRIATARAMIAEFRSTLRKFLEEGPKDTVLRVNVQMFPIEKGE